jgi:hypothetical protein
LRKVAEAIEKAGTKIIEMNIDLRATPFETVSASENGLEREMILELENRGLSQLSEPYSEAFFIVPSNAEPHELYTRDMAAIVLRIIEHEGPIHEEEVVTRVRTLWSKGRAGSRIHDAVARAIRALETSKSCVRLDKCLMLPGCNVRVRNRANVTSPTLRKPEHLPTLEIHAAVLALLEANHGAARNEIPTAVARLFGFQATSSQFKVVIESHVEILLRTGKIQEVNKTLKVVSERVS